MSYGLSERQWLQVISDNEDWHIIGDAPALSLERVKEIRDEVFGKRAVGTLPYPPSANRYWRVFNGNVVLSTEAREYKEMSMYMWDGQPKQGDVSVTLKVYRPRKSGDLDNRIKVLLDALNGLAYEDDKQVVELHAYRFDDKDDPRVEIIVEEA